MLLNKHNLAIAALADKEPSRYTLNAIHVSPKWTATTNGHYLVTVTLPEAKDEKFPAIEGFEPTNGNTPSFLLAPADALAIAKAIPKKQTIPILENASVGKQGDRIQLAVTDLESPKVTTISKVEGQFPNIETVIPKASDTKLTIGLDAEYLLKLAKSAIETCKESSRDKVHIKIELKDATHAVKMTAKNAKTGQEWMAVLMPVRL